jgi:hypothetical protein
MCAMPNSQKLPWSTCLQQPCASSNAACLTSKASTHGEPRGSAPHLWHPCVIEKPYAIADLQLLYKRTAWSTLQANTHRGNHVNPATQQVPDISSDKAHAIFEVQLCAVKVRPARCPNRIYLNTQAENHVNPATQQSISALLTTPRLSP